MVVYFSLFLKEVMKENIVQNSICDASLRPLSSSDASDVNTTNLRPEVFAFGRKEGSKNFY